MFQVSKVGKNHTFSTHPQQFCPPGLLLNNCHRVFCFCCVVYCLGTGFNKAGKMLRVRCDAFLWKHSDPEHGCCGEMSPCAPGRSQSTRTLVPSHTAAPPLPFSVWTCRRWAAAGCSSSGPAPCSASPHPEPCSIAARNPAASPWTGQTPRPLPPSPGQPATARRWA